MLAPSNRGTMGETSQTLMPKTTMKSGCNNQLKIFRQVTTVSMQPFTKAIHSQPSNRRTYKARKLLSLAWSQSAAQMTTIAKLIPKPTISRMSSPFATPTTTLMAAIPQMTRKRRHIRPIQPRTSQVSKITITTIIITIKIIRITGNTIISLPAPPSTVTVNRRHSTTLGNKYLNAVVLSRLIHISSNLHRKRSKHRWWLRETLELTDSPWIKKCSQQFIAKGLLNLIERTTSSDFLEAEITTNSNSLPSTNCPWVTTNSARHLRHGQGCRLARANQAGRDFLCRRCRVLPKITMSCTWWGKDHHSSNSILI